ncbi:hypothetical protein PCASD_20780 [Puccinia coronata f. sp. avenae]|uniref:Uncharacterized protein n=1 Tax=Puccinia coronata f. sp. avenae TaxID=200324 RepID=A0A2N5S8E8_9BASI|nr:hypothetical protein PCASD_20780 [Puccinia coronata f. sp. avenae]
MWFRFLYLHISLCYFTWATQLTSCSESFLPSASDVNSEIDADLFDDLDLQWVERYSSSLRGERMSNWLHEYDSDSLAFTDNSVGYPLLDDFNKQGAILERIPGSGIDGFMRIQPASASNEGATLRHQLEVGEPTQPDPTEKEGLRPASQTRKLPKGHRFQICIQSRQYKGDGRRDTAGADLQYFGTSDTIFNLHQQARICLTSQQNEDVEVNRHFEIGVSEKLQDIATQLRRSSRSPVTSGKGVEGLRMSDTHPMSSLAIRLSLEDRSSTRKTTAFIRKIGLVGYNLNIFHHLFAHNGMDEKILGGKTGNYREILRWLDHLIFTDPDPHHLPLDDRASQNAVPFDPKHSVAKAQSLLSRFLTDPTPRMGKFMAAPVALDLLQIWYQLKCFELQKPIISPGEFKWLLQQKRIIQLN